MILVWTSGVCAFAGLMMALEGAGLVSAVYFLGSFVCTALALEVADGGPDE